MLEVSYSTEFFRKLKNLPEDLQEEVFEKIDLFKNKKNHQVLKVHKLKGKLQSRFSFSVDYKFRIIFKYISNKEAFLLTIGDHSIYK